jgi:hypothetical protein
MSWSAIIPSLIRDVLYVSFLFLSSYAFFLATQTSLTAVASDWAGKAKVWIASNPGLASTAEASAPSSVASVPPLQPVVSKPVSWLDLVRTRGIQPSVGLGGISLGQQHASVIAETGVPNSTQPLMDKDGKEIGVSVNYMDSGVQLTAQFSAARQVERIVLIDRSFGLAFRTPTVKGIQFGSTESSVVERLGKPTARELINSNACEVATQEGRATRLRYPGVDFTLCNKNALLAVVAVVK